MSLWDDPRHPSDAGAHEDVVGAARSCTKMLGAGEVFGEKQAPRSPCRGMPGRHSYLLCSLLRKSATAQWDT